MKRLVIALLALLAAASAALAQDRRTYTQAELDQMLAPIALYPDALLSQVLMASTYPLDIVEAARWTRTHPGLQGDEAVGRVADEDWDPSVKSLVAFPRLLQRMDENLAWTRRLGEAFLEQEPHVMETVQQLRRRAEAAGHLLPDGRLRTIADGDTIIIESADPRVVYVPYYDPWVAYGVWHWPAYPPVAWSPWTGYAIGVTTGFFFGGIDWHHRHVKVVHVHNHYLRGHHHAHAPIHVGKWHHAPRQQRVVRRHDEREIPFAAPLARPMPPALSASPPPRHVERDRRFERRFDDDRRGERDRRNERPAARERPANVEVPRIAESPRRAEPPRRMEPARQIEPPRQAEQPRRMARPQRIERPAHIERPRHGERPRGGGWERRAQRNGPRS